MPDTAASIGHNSAAVLQVLHDEPEVLFREPDMLEQLVEELEAEIAGTEIDLTTAKGRKAITALASRITTFKTTLDKTGKHLNEKHRAAIGKVDTVRRDVRSRLDELKAKARKPLTDWEEAEARRTNIISTLKHDISRLGEVSPFDTAAKIASRIDQLKSIEIDPDIFQAEYDAAEQSRHAVIAQLETVHTKQLQAEKDAAELERLRKEQAEREQREAAKRREAEEAKAAQARAEAEAAERKAAEERAAQAAAEKARRDAEAAAEAKLAEERRRADEAEAQIKREAEAKAKAEAEEAARRADEEHRSSVMREIEGGLMAQANISADTAQLMVLAMVAGNIPHVEVKF